MWSPRCLMVGYLTPVHLLMEITWLACHLEPLGHTLGRMRECRMCCRAGSGRCASQASMNCSMGSGLRGSQSLVMAADSLGSTTAPTSCVYGSLVAATSCDSIFINIKPINIITYGDHLWLPLPAAARSSFITNHIIESFRKDCVAMLIGLGSPSLLQSWLF